MLHSPLVNADAATDADGARVIAPRRHRAWPVVAVLAGVIVFQMLLSVFSIGVLSAVRAYVGGESLYSKGQKDAQHYLLDFLEFRREDDFRRFSSALAVPLGDRAAREALERAQPDTEAARAGFLAGGNDLADIDGLIWLFRWFHDSPLMADAIARWTAGDAAIMQMRARAEAAHARFKADPDAPAASDLRMRTTDLNNQLTMLAHAFSASLSAASREAQWWLLSTNLTAAALLGAGGLGFVRRSLRQRAAAEVEIRRRQELLRQLLDSMADAVLTMDADGRIVLFNRAAETIFRARMADSLGGSISTLVAPGSRELLDRLRREPQGLPDTAAAVAPLHEVRCLRSDGAEFPAEMSISRLETEDGKLVTIILRDVSEKELAREERQARHALEASSRAKTAFLSRMSHELRTPLNAVLGFARLMTMDTGRPLDNQNMLRVGHIETAGAHLLALVNDILDLSRIESGEMALSLEAVDIAPVAAEALSVIMQLAHDGGVLLDAGLAVDAQSTEAAPRMLVIADRVRLRQVLINVLSNAVKYTPRDGRITLRVRATDNICELSVADTGVGMTPEQLSHLFEPFNRLGAERSAIEGTGIGLVLTRHLVALMGGELAIVSVRGQGTVATVSLQRRHGGEVPVVRSDVAAPSPARGRATLEVLYAEDNEVNVELVRQVAHLRPEVSLRVALSGSMALQMAHACPPRLMLVDMQLGDMTGIELARLLRSDPVTAGIRFVALSADALPEQIDAALRNGFDEYLTKPINFVEILRVFAAHSDAE